MTDATTADAAYGAGTKRITLYWVIVGLILFPVLAVLGLVMRTLQAGYFAATRRSGSTR